MPSKTKINRQFNDIWCYLSIACFDWETGLFQQTVVKVYYVLKEINRLRKEINRLLSKGMSNVYFKITIEKF